jgi:FixJ family two-component response regulator
MAPIYSNASRSDAQPPGATVVIVDDEVALARTLGDVLAEEGIRAITWDESSRAIPVLFCTAHTDQLRTYFADRPPARMLVLQKPFALETFVSTVRSMLEVADESQPAEARPADRALERGTRDPDR